MKNMRKHFFLILIYFGITCIITFPLIFHLSSYSIEDDADSYLMQWALARNVQKLSSDPLNFFEANYFYPHKNTLAYTEHQLGNSILAFPIIKIFNNPLLALNILVILSYVLSGWGTYLLVFRLTKNHYAGFLAGIIFAFNPFRAIHISQLHVISTQYLPFILLYLEKIFESSRLKYYFLFSLFLIFQFITSLHLFIFISAAVVIFIALKYLLNRKQFSPKLIIYFFISFLIVFLINLPLLIPYFQLKDVAGSDVYMTSYYTPSLSDYLKITPLIHKFLGYPKESDRIFYPGIIVLIFLLLSIFWIFKRKSKTKDLIKKRALIYLIILISVFLLSFGPYIRFTPQAGSVPGPYLVLEELIPGESNIRAVGRFMIIGILAIAVLVGYGMTQFFDFPKGKKIYLVVFSIAILGEYLFVPPFSPLKLVARIEDESKVAVSQWIAQQAGNFAILEIPLGKSNLTEARYMYYSTYHWKDRINGFSGYYPQEYLDLKRVITEFPSAKSLMTIGKYNPKYVIVHFDEIEPPFRRIYPKDLKGIDGLKLVFHSINTYVYQFSAQDL